MIAGALIAREIPEQCTAAVLTAVRKMELAHVGTPAIGSDELLVRVLVTGICGSDLATYNGTHPYKRPPVILGHEFSGVVVARGANADAADVGDVVCAASFSHCGVCSYCKRNKVHLCSQKDSLGHNGLHGSFAGYIKLKNNMTYRLPSHIEPMIGALVEPLAIGLHAVRILERTRPHTVSIIGAGNIGLSCLIAVQQLGIRQITCVDIGPKKGRLAVQLGAAAYIDVTQGLSHSGRVASDATIVASGHPLALEEASLLTKKGGTIVVVSYFSEPVVFDATSWVRNEHALQGSALSSPTDFQDVIGWLDNEEIEPSPMITHQFPLTRAAEALALMNDAVGTAGKIMLHHETQ